MLYIDLSANHSLGAANAHYYKEPTEEHYIDRVMQCHDLIYLIEGGWSFTEDGTEYPLRKDDVLILAAGRHHFSQSPCLPGTRTFCIHISCEPGDSGDNPDAACLQTLMNAGNDSSVKKCFDDIVSTYWKDTPYREQKLTSLVNLLLLSLYEAQENRRSRKDDLATRAIEIITASPHERFTSKQVADMLFVSTRTLDNAMHKKVGMPFYTYMKNKRLDMVALQLFMEPHLKLREIAAAFGFHDEFHMSKAFKQKFGVSPAEYRSANLEK